MKGFQLVFIPSPGLSHLVSTVQTAKLLLQRDQRLSITILIIKLPNDTLKVDNYIQKFTSNVQNATNTRLTFTNLPILEDTSNFKNFVFDYIDNQVTNVRNAVSELMGSGSQLAGLVLDMFCLRFIDVANEFDLPSYVFFTSGAISLGLFHHIISLKFEQNKELTEFKDSDEVLHVPCFSKPVPAKVLPSVFVDASPMSLVFLSSFRRMTETKGIMVNTFYELEPFAIEALSKASSYPKVYPVGPIMHLSNDDEKKSSLEDEIMKWLDSQPESSVVFLCFGTMGSFEEHQVKEIAKALENSGNRFLLALRKPGEKGMFMPVEYDNFLEVLPEGFLDRTEGVGKVIGWAPQAAVLAHPAVGGFVSHCGWNSTLESVWHGVPIAALPLYAEQQVNAFYLVKEAKMAEEIKIDYKRDVRGEKPSELVRSEVIEAAIRRLMADEGESRVRQKVKEMKEKSRMALLEGGSSYNAQALFIEDVINNLA